MYVKGEQKAALGKKRGGKACASCPKYEGFFRLVHAPTDAPAAGVKYTIRSRGKQVWEGVTDDKGHTEILRTKKPTHVTLEISLAVVRLDAEGNERGRTREKVVLAEGVTQRAPVADPLASARVGDRIHLKLVSSGFADLAVWRLTYVVASLKYAPSLPPSDAVFAPHVGSTGLHPDTKGERIEFSFSRSALLAVEALIVTGVGAPPGDVRLAPLWRRDLAKDAFRLPVNAAQVCAGEAACVLEYELEVERLQILRKNIIFVGSELHYDSFWWKMMFIAPAYTTGKGGGPARPADRTTIAYVEEGYTPLEILRLTTLGSVFGHELVALEGSADILRLMNDTPLVPRGRFVLQTKLQDVLFFCHGVPGQIAMNYPKANVTLDLSNFAGIREDVFVQPGTIRSYACRTGINDDSGSFSSDAEADPRNSLAQKMADRLQVTMYAFLTRSFYRHVLRNPEDSKRISDTLKARRLTSASEEIELTEDLVALRHPGLAESGGARREGTNGFALWPRAGARQMPISHDTPRGLTHGLRVFKPGG